MNLLEQLSEPWAIRALVAASMVGIMCGVLGAFVVLRNMSLIGDALSHAVLPGVVVGYVTLGAGLGIFFGAVGAGLFSAVLITLVQQTSRTKPDAAIGIIFTWMFSLGVMGISYISKNQGVHLDLKDFLFGNVLAVRFEDLILTFIILAVTLGSVAIYYRPLFASTFQPVVAQTMGVPVKSVHYILMLLLSFVVVASLQTVGVILVVAMLITPAATALLLSNRLPVVITLSAVIGLVTAVLGFLLALQFETTPGPAMAVTAAHFFLLALLFSPTRGVVVQWFRNRAQRGRIRKEDLLKNALHLAAEGNLTPELLSARLGCPPAQCRKSVRNLIASGHIAMTGGKLTLTTKGEKVANRLVRAHRLWETYLVQQMGVPSDHIHEDAEKFEHLFSDEFLDQLDENLGFPDVDPHGSPIPK